MVQHHTEIPFGSKGPINCIQAYEGGTKSDEEVTRIVGKPALIFTHGAGGTLSSDGIAKFSLGFAKSLPILCFQGNMNLKSRVKMFSAVMENREFAACLGGRSMGARAAVMAATTDTKMLILASYPLHTAKETRDQILLSIDPAVDVLFIEGDRDDMCDLERFEGVRKKMKCKTWLIVVKGADHSMNISPKSATAEVVSMTGELAAQWIQDRDDTRKRGRISWDDGVKWSGWEQDVLKETEKAKPKIQASREQRPAAKREKPAPLKRNEPEDASISSRTRKRRKV